MFLILLCAANFEAGIVLNLILIFELFEACCSYKIVLIKRKECSVCEAACKFCWILDAGWVAGRSPVVTVSYK